MKEKVTISLKRLKNGEVIGEIVGEISGIIETRHFGKMSEAEVNRIFEIFKEENPEIEIMPVELAGN